MTQLLILGAIFWAFSADINMGTGPKSNIGRHTALLTNTIAYVLLIAALISSFYQ